jgi:hypothetical protein
MGFAPLVKPDVAAKRIIKHLRKYPRTKHPKRSTISIGI